VSAKQDSFKEGGVIAAWTAGTLLLAVLLWTLTGPLREARMIQAVNRALETRRDQRRIRRDAEHRLSGMPEFLGQRYALENSDGSAVVFPVFSRGVFASCIAFVSQEGLVSEIMPLNSHSEKILGRLGGKVLGMYVGSIEHALADGNE
jgi:hypothetical protein